MNYVTHTDGSITFKGVAPTLPNYRVDPTDPSRLIPDFPVCEHRIKDVSVLRCGAISVCWRCSLKGQVVSVPFCRSCDVIQLNLRR